MKLGDVVVFEVKVARGSQTAKARADAAAAALREATKTASPEDVRVEQRADVAVLYAGATPIIQLYPEDAVAAGDAALADHAANVAAKVRDALRGEQKRSVIANKVFSISLVVLAALLALYLLRKAAEFTERARTWITAHPERIPTLRLYSLEVVRPAALRSALVVSLGVLRWVGQISVVYFWLLGSLSLFDSTRGYTEKLSGVVVTPVSGLLGRVVSALPLLLVTAIAAVAVLVLLRFVAMFFTSIGRGETKVGWLSAELAEPTSMVLRAGIVVAVLVFGAPIVTGDSEGALSRTGSVLLVALGIGATPLLATALAGVAVVYSRRLSAGAWAEIDGRVGRVRSVGFLEIRLEDVDGGEIRIPHLLCLVKASRLLPHGPRPQVEIAVAADAKPSSVQQLLESAASDFGEAWVELIDADADGIRFRVSVEAQIANTPSKLRARLLDALSEGKVGLGRAAGRA